MRRSRAMSESDSLRRKKKEEPTANGNRVSCGALMKDYASGLIEGPKNTHASVRRVSSMPITSSAAVSHLVNSFRLLGEVIYSFLSSNSRSERHPRPRSNLNS